LIVKIDIDKRMAELIVDNLLLPVLIIIILFGAGFAIFKLKRKNNLNEAPRDNNAIVVKAAEVNRHKHDDISRVVEIILRNELGQEISFTRPNKLSTMKYQEVIVSETAKAGGHLVQSAIPILACAQTLTEITKQASGGVLFASTVDPATLSKFANGTTTTMVRDAANNLVGHAGFRPIDDLGGLNPLTAVNIGMQAMSAVSGQYYLHQIFSQLDGINSSLEHLIEFHHDEKIGVLLNAKIRLGEVIQRNSVDEADVKEIRDLRNKVGEIFQEYKLRLDREHKSVAEFKPRTLLVEKRVDSYGEEIDKVAFTVQVCFEADKLSIQAELAEIAVRMKLNCVDPMLEELLAQLKENYDNSFSTSISSNIMNIFESINSNAQKIVGSGKDFIFIDRKPEKLLKYISDKSDHLEKLLDAKVSGHVANQVMLERNIAQEMLIMADVKLQNQRVFVPVVERD